MGGATQYRAAPNEWRAVALDTLTAIYHRPSGITHVVAAPVPEILEALAAGPATIEELLARLQAAFELRDPDRAALAARLEEMAAAGLVARG